MTNKRPKKISLTKQQKKILEKFSNGRKSSRGLANRSRIILYWAEGRGVRETARDMELDTKTVLSWRWHWLMALKEWSEAQKKWSFKELREKICEAFADAPRSGTPPKFTPEQVCKIISIACKKPSDLGVPVSHWSASDLRREVIKQGVVPEISARTIGRFLKRLISSHTA